MFKHSINTGVVVCLALLVTACSMSDSQNTVGDITALSSSQVISSAHNTLEDSEQPDSTLNFKHSEYEKFGDISSYRLKNIQLSNADGKSTDILNISLLLPQSCSIDSVINYHETPDAEGIKAGEIMPVYYKLANDENITENSFLPFSSFSVNSMTGEKYTMEEIVENKGGAYWYLMRGIRYIENLDAENNVVHYVINLEDNCLAGIYFYVSASAVSAELEIYDQIAESLFINDFSTEFLDKAYALGYTDKQLHTLKSQWRISDDKILNITPSTDMLTSPNGRYGIDGYILDEDGMQMNFCMYFIDTQTGKTTILPDWQNGYSEIDFLDNETFYTSVVHVGGASYGSKVSIYKVNEPNIPYASWILADVAEADEKLLLTTYNSKNEKLLISFWCYAPDDWSEPSGYYSLTIMDYDGNIVKVLDTEIPLARSKTGIGIPNMVKPNDMINPTEGIVYFDLGDTMYSLNVKTGEITTRQP